MTATASTFRYFAVCSPGLEPLLLDELKELGQDGSALKGGVAFQGPFESLWTVAHRSRIAESVRLRLKPFLATDFGRLYEQLSHLPFHAYLPAHRDYDVSVSCSESKLYHTAAVEERFRDVITKAWSRMGKTADDDAPHHDKLTFFIRIFRNEVTVSVDATGERLHRRGYRTHVGVAPIRETLAAASCRLLDKQVVPGPLRAIWDPCCGSGTLLCEWLWPRLFNDLPQVGTRKRSFAFESYPCHPKARYQAFLSQPSSPLRVDVASTLEAFGSDSDAAAIKAALTNLTQAGVESRCTLLPCDLREAAARIPKGTAVLTNLPYGVRLKQTRGAPRAFTLLDNVLTRRPDLRPAVAISTERPPRIGPSNWQPGCHFANGGLAVTAWVLR